MNIEHELISSLKTELANKHLIGDGIKLSEREYSPSMLLEAALVLISVWQLALRYQCTFDDVSLDMFRLNKKGQIVFNDLEYLVTNNKKSLAFIPFFRSFLGPLFLLNKHSDLLQMLRRSGVVTPLEYLTLTHSIFMKGPRHWSHRLAHSRLAPLLALGLYHAAWVTIKTKNTHSDLWLERALSGVQKKLSSLDFSNLQEKWTGYYAGIPVESIAATKIEKIPEKLDFRQKAIFEVLKSLPHESVLDIGANKGLFSILAAKAGHKVISVDYDIGAIDALYRDNKKYGLPILPAVVDFHELISDKTSRFVSSYSLALGFTHHLYLVEGLSWDEMTSVFSKLTEKLLVTEFKSDTGASHPERQITQEQKDNYNLKSFMKALKLCFNSVEIIEHESSSQRQLLLCKKN